MNNREAFEAWYKKEMCGFTDFSRNELGHYEDFDVRHDWDVWQAALASQAQQPKADFDSEQLARRLQSFLDRLCNDNYSAIMFEGDACSLREAIEKLRNNIKKSKLQSQAQQPANVWQQAIDDELVNAHLGVAQNGVTREKAKEYLNKLIAWHIDVDKYFESQEQQEPYAYDVPTKDGTELAYAIYFTKYNNPLPEGSIPLYAIPPAPEGE